MEESADRIHRHESENTPDVCPRSSGAARAQPGAIKMTENMIMGKDVRIADIAMLGSHDAGTHNIKNIKGISVCQNRNLLEQAEAGVQYFDLRVRTNSKGEWKFYHGEKNRGRGFNASGPAEPELEALFEYAKEHPKDLFLFKFHFDLSTNDEDQVAEFLENYISKWKNQLIERSGNKLLGHVTMGESVHNRKNIGILAHHAGKGVKKNPYIWNYQANTYGGWGKTPKAGQLIKHLTKNIREKNTEEKILVSQTNLPAMIPPSLKVLLTPRAWLGLKSLAGSAHEEVAKGVENAMNGRHNPGVISGDFVGTEYASTAKYTELRDRHNAPFRRGKVRRARK